MIYVDKTQRYPSGRWCHMMVGTHDSIEELHAFAKRIGLKREWFQDLHQGQYPHYDLRVSKRKLAVLCGAKEVDSLSMHYLCRRPRRLDVPESEFFSLTVHEVSSASHMSEDAADASVNLARLMNVPHAKESK